MAFVEQVAEQLDIERRQEASFMTLLSPPVLTLMTSFLREHQEPNSSASPLMIRRGVLKTLVLPCRQYATQPPSRGLRPVPILSDASIDTFKSQAFEPQTPTLLPRQHYSDLPAVHKWFSRDPKTGLNSLNSTYLAKYGSTLVPLEISNNEHFARVEQSLSFFLECVKASSSTFSKHRNRYFSSYTPGARAVKRTKQSNDFFTSATNTTTPTARVYLAQAPLADLPRGLANDVPTPEIVSKAGKGDVYDSSIWLGLAPTYTPLHRDPNPNIFVQLAGKKVVRIFGPHVGRAIFAKVQEKIGGSASATMRGEEMMQGLEKQALEEEVWEQTESDLGECWEAELEAGDGIFIPKGWWHSIKGIGPGMTGSVCHILSFHKKVLTLLQVNWWFR